MYCAIRNKIVPQIYCTTTLLYVSYFYASIIFVRCYRDLPHRDVRVGRGFGVAQVPSIIIYVSFLPNNWLRRQTVFCPLVVDRRVQSLGPNMTGAFDYDFEGLTCMCFHAWSYELYSCCWTVAIRGTKGDPKKCFLEVPHNVHK